MPGHTFNFLLKLLKVMLEVMTVALALLKKTLLQNNFFSGRSIHSLGSFGLR